MNMNKRIGKEVTIKNIKTLSQANALVWMQYNQEKTTADKIANRAAYHYIGILIRECEDYIDELEALEDQD